MKSLRLFAIVLVCFLTSSAVAQNQFTNIDSWLANNVANLGGRVFLLVYKDGKIIYSKGESELSARQKMAGKFIAKRQGKTFETADYTASSIVPIASSSKWLSAALVMTYIDEGKLKLTDTVGKFLPSLSKTGKGKITISQCLSHTTAIKAESLKEDLQNMRSFQSMDASIANIATLPMEGEPGKVFHYSNTGLQIAGAVVEKISGKSFEKAFQERIAKPLAMSKTSFGDKNVVLPAGGASSSAEDYMNFLVMILNKGIFNGKRILSENSIKLMQVNQITADVKVAYTPLEAGDVGYGYGEWVYKTATLANLNGAVSSPGLFGSYPVVDNQRQYAAFLMTYNLKSNGRQERYAELKKLLDLIK